MMKGRLDLTSGNKKSLNIILTVLTEIMDRVSTSFLNRIKNSIIKIIILCHALGISGFIGIIEITSVHLRLIGSAIIEEGV